MRSRSRHISSTLSPLEAAQHRVKRSLERADQTLAEFLKDAMGNYKEPRMTTVHRTRFNGSAEPLLEQQFTLERRPGERTWKTKFTGDILREPSHPAIQAVRDQRNDYHHPAGRKYRFDFAIDNHNPVAIEKCEGTDGSHRIFTPIYRKDRSGRISAMGLMAISGSSLGIVGSATRGLRMVREAMVLASGIRTIVSTLTYLLEDPLTTLPGRRDFNIKIEELVARHRATGKPLALLFLDIDHFKRINDQNDHITGDLVLKKFAECLLHGIRRKPLQLPMVHGRRKLGEQEDFRPDEVHRCGGEEFVILAPDTDLRGALILAEKVRERVEAIDVNGIHITCSIGVVGTDGLSWQALKNSNAKELGREMYRMGDTAMLAAKEAGRNTVYYTEWKDRGYRAIQYTPEQ